MKNTTGLYKHQRDNQSKRRNLPSGSPRAKVVPLPADHRYEYEKATQSPYDLNGLKEFPGE